LIYQNAITMEEVFIDHAETTIRLAVKMGYKPTLIVRGMIPTEAQVLAELHLVQKWIRDEFNYEVIVKHNPHSQGNKGLWEYTNSPIFEKGHILTSLDTPKRYSIGCGLETFEMALSVGINEAIKRM